ncbi:MAG: ABC transporter permease [Lachnospiraceae bacterium]|nr:ABC transporter permease [Lachnospiraceae bacterium]
MKQRMIKKCFHQKAGSAVICISVIILFLMTVLTQSYEDVNSYRRKQTYGFHNGAVFDAQTGARETLLKHKAVKSMGIMEVYGEILLEDDPQARYLGSVDEEFCRMEQLLFLEGSYPQNETEIAMEAVLLDQMHISYELGTQVSFLLSDENGQMTEKSYTLCGIMDNWTSHWLTDGNTLCGALILPGKERAVSTNLFFLSEHKNSKQMEELQSRFLSKTGNHLLYNEYAYPEKITSISLFMEKGAGIGFIALLGAGFLLCFQFSSWAENRHRMRVLKLIGLSDRDLQKMSVKVMIFAWLKAAAAGTGISCLIWAVVLLVLHSGVPWSAFRITAFPFLVSESLSFLIMMAGNLVQIQLIKHTEVIPKGRDLTRCDESLRWQKRKKQKRKTDYCQFSPEIFKKIEKQRFRRQNYLERGFIFISMAVIILCAKEIGSQYQYEKGVYQENSCQYRWEGGLYTGLDREQIQSIRNTENIEEVDYWYEFSGWLTGRGQILYLGYSGSENDPYMECVNKGKDTRTGEMEVSFMGIEPHSPLWDYYAEYMGSAENEIARGNAVMVFLPDIVPADGIDDGLVNYFDFVNVYGVDETDREIMRPALQEGSKLDLYVDGKQYSVSCGKILRNFHEKGSNTKNLISFGTVIMSDNLYRKMISGIKENGEGDSGKQLPCNRVTAYGNRYLNYDVSDRKMSAVFRDNGVIFYNLRLEQEQSRKNFISNVIFLLGIILFTATATTVICSRSRARFLESESERMKVLFLLGEGGRWSKRLYSAEHHKFIAGCVIFWNFLLIPGMLLIRYYGQRWTYGIADFHLYWKVMLYQFPWVWYSMVQVVYVLVLLGVSRMSGKEVSFNGYHSHTGR